jgi:hypothetical protein
MESWCHEMAHVHSLRVCVPESKNSTHLLGGTSIAKRMLAVRLLLSKHLNSVSQPSSGRSLLARTPCAQLW